jgi:hypothetical protein
MKPIHLRLLISALFLLLPSIVVAASTDNDGRYQAVVLHTAGASSGAGAISPKVFILDTREGHMWTWEQNARVKRRKGGLSFGNLLIYHGKLRPGNAPGEVVSESK